MKRLWCRVRGHDVVRVVTRLELEDLLLVAGAEPAVSWRGRVTKSHRECRRCGRNLEVRTATAV